MKNRTIAALLAAAMSCTIFMLSACSAEVKGGNHPVDVAESVEIMRLDMFIDTNEISNKTELDMSKTLNKSNGKYVNLYVENNGANSVVATINGQSERTFQPGEKGHIYVEVTQGFLGFDREYVFKVVPGTNGESVNIHYEIAQRDYQ